jgi:hypothetical protein
MLTFKENVKKFGKPIQGKVYDCKLQSFTSGKIVEEKLVAVFKDDCAWRTADDFSEINEMNWNVIEWHLAKEK